MNSELISENVQAYLRSHLNTAVSEFALKKSPFKSISPLELSIQLDGLQRAKLKLPSWFKNHGILYPPKINLEQCSSEIAAIFKAGLISGSKLIDLSCGFGVDSILFSEKVEQITACDINQNLIELAHHNAHQLNAHNIEFKNIDGIEFLEDTDKYFDWIYVDPSRRTAKGKKVFRFQEASPNVIEPLELFKKRAKYLLIKASPLIDIKRSISDLKYVKEVYVVAINNEVKEVLFILDWNPCYDPVINSVNLTEKDKQAFRFRYSEEKAAILNFQNPKKFIYEPNSAILKAGGFKSVAAAYSVEKLAEHSHLYTSDILVDFPGRSFELVKEIDFNNKNIKQLIFGKKSNISTRNFPIKTSELRRKYKLRDGGDNYWFFTTDSNGDLKVLTCNKV